MLNTRSKRRRGRQNVVLQIWTSSRVVKPRVEYQKQVKPTIYWFPDFHDLSFFSCFFMMIHYCMKTDHEGIDGHDASFSFEQLFFKSKTCPRVEKTSKYRNKRNPRYLDFEIFMIYRICHDFWWCSTVAWRLIMKWLMVMMHHYPLENCFSSRKVALELKKSK